eukprot:334916_1
MFARGVLDKLQTKLINLSIRNKYSINHSFLDDGLISHEHAWFWGMLLTDGNISISVPSGSRNNTLRWAQKYDSYPMLESIRTVIQSTHPITFLVRKLNNKLYPACELNLHSKHLATSASHLIGCMPGRKTFDLKYPESMDPIFTSSLIRGIVDGDGCWGFMRRKQQRNPTIYLSFSSASITFLQSIQKVINQECLKSSSDPGKIYGVKTYFQLNYHCQSELNEIGEWMYNTNKIDVDN